MNEAILKKVQAIYGAPSLESVNPMNETENTETEVFDETPALEAYSEEELELLHQEIVEEYTAAMEAITPELANLEYTIMLESIGLSLDRFNEFEGVVSMEAVKKAVKDGKVTKDSAFKSIYKRILSVFWTMIDMVTGNYVNVLKYGKLVIKYKHKLNAIDKATLSGKTIKIDKHVSIERGFTRLVNENSIIFNKFKMLGSSNSSPKSVMGGIYQIFGDIGVKVNTDGKEQFEEKYNKFKETISTDKELESSNLDEVRSSLVKDADAIINALKELPKDFRAQINTVKKKLNGAKDLEAAKPEQEGMNKKAIQEDLNRCMKLIGEYKNYNKKCTQLLKTAIKGHLSSVGKFIDVANGKSAAKEEKKEETK